MSRRHTFTFIVILFSCIATLTAQSGSGEREFSRWLSADSRAARYRTVEDDLARVFKESERTGVPPELLLEKLKEGAAKNVPASRIVPALEAELERLAFAKELSDRLGLYRTEPDKRAGLFRTVSIFLLSGFSPSLVDEVFSAAFERASIENRDRTSAQDSAVERADEALHTLLQIGLIYRFSDDELVGLGRAVIASGIPVSGYRSLASVFLKANSYRMSGAETIGLVTEILSNRGGLLQIEQELQRRSRRR